MNGAAIARPAESLSGTTALVTGATSGIGFEASVKLARLGAEVLMVARDEVKGRAAVAEVKRRGGSSRVSLLRCDFAVQESIRSLASAVRSRHDRVHVLVNNAGGLSPTRQVTVDGLERTFAVNHLGYFLLTNLLLDVLKASAPSRIVNVSSVGHNRGDLDFGNLQYEQGGYDMLKAYGRSKLANILFTTELARRLAGTGVTVNCLNPGAVATNIWSSAPWQARPVLAIMKLFMIKPQEGADRIVYLAANADVARESGGYFDKDLRVPPCPLAQDDVMAKRLWDVSAELVGL
jgi:retinol dehydrogenase-14